MLPAASRGSIEMGHLAFILGTLAIALGLGHLTSDPAAARGYLIMWGLLSLRFSPKLVVSQG